MSPTRLAASRGSSPGGGRLDRMPNATSASGLRHTKVGAGFANPDRLTPRDFDLDGETRGIWRQITEHRDARVRLSKSPVGHIVYRLRRAGERSDPLEVVARLIISAANVGIPEAKVRLLSFYLDSVIDRCFAGRAHRSIEELDRDELTRETEENRQTLERWIAAGAGRTPTPAELEAEAAANEEEAAVQIERARLLRRLARAQVLTAPSPREPAQ